MFPVFKKIGFSGILGPPYSGIGATIRIGREILCLPYAGFLKKIVCIYTIVSAKIKGPHPYPRIGRHLLSYRTTHTLLEGTIVSLVRVGVAL